MTFIPTSTLSPSRRVFSTSKKLPCANDVETCNLTSRYLARLGICI